MRTFSCVIFIAIVLCFFCQTSASAQPANISKASLQRVINQQLSKLQAEQVKQDQDFKYFPPQFQEQKGLYGSEIKLNLMDKENTLPPHLFREEFHIFDNNMFVTNFVLLGLLESSDLGFISIDQQSVKQAIEALLTFKDKNQHDNSTAIYNFWSQININGTWSSYPKNLESLVDVFEKLPPWIQKISELIGMDPKELQQMVKAFTIPPDNDDSGLNAALQSILNDHRSVFPELANLWETDYSTLYDAAKKYAYRPLESIHHSNFSTNASDIIDPRSYYYLHSFINENKDYPLAFFSTWLMNQNDEVGDILSMPFHTNNVDLTVNANSLFGLNHVLLAEGQIEKAQSLFDQDLRGIYVNVTNLLAFGISSGIVLNRTDLALTYYPSEYDFYWFAARNVHLLRSAKQANNGNLPFEEMEYALQTLNDVMANEGISQLLSLAQNNSENTQTYWSGFLGNYANKSRNEDSLFSTAVTINTLLDLYTVTNKVNTTTKSESSTKRSYLSTTPQSIKNLITRAIHYIVNQVEFNLNASYLNTFFSGSVKGMEQLPYFYPSNYAVYKNNNTSIDPAGANINVVNDQLINAFKGTISDEEYEQLLSESWYGFPTPEQFTGFNTPPASFPFWSSEPITRVFIIQALAKYSSATELN